MCRDRFLDVSPGFACPGFCPLPLSHLKAPSPSHLPFTFHTPLPATHTEEQLCSVGNVGQEEMPWFWPLLSQHQRSGAVSTGEETLHV